MVVFRQKQFNYQREIDKFLTKKGKDGYSALDLAYLEENLENEVYKNRKELNKRAKLVNNSGNNVLGNETSVIPEHESGQLDSALSRASKNSFKDKMTSRETALIKNKIKKMKL